MNKMKKINAINTTAFILISLIYCTIIGVSATEYQTADIKTEESSMDCEVIYKATYDFTETIPKYPESDNEGDSTDKDNTINSNSQNNDGIKQDIGLNVQTGDNSKILFYGLLFVCSSICLIKKKRKERKNL